MAYSETDTKLNASAGLASVGVAALLVALKLWALWQTGALSVAASLADSAVDLIISAGGLAAILYAAKPADDDHAFGHSSAEDLAALGQSLVILASAALIGYSAIHRLMAPEPHPLSAQSAGIVVMVISALVTGGLIWWQSRVARATGNKVVAADRLHYVGDLLPTLGAIGALWVSHAFGWGQIDSMVALIAAALMIAGALRIGSGAWNALMDRAAPNEVITGIAELARNHPGVRGFHDLKTRTAGAQIFVNLHIELDGDQTLEQAHDIGAALKRKILAAYPQTDVIIHKDVWRG
ncbi:cation diffusion facilitator family transporter [Thioclava sp.]|uniref:cation diffusion facilitator family transporter n=1 Tax=Thioclava sp. TaxID=1933450 RepID=UPI003AA9CEA4